MLKTNDERILSIKKHSWSGIRNEIKKLNGKLYEQLDLIPSINKYIFFELLYPFGMDIIKNGKMYYPLIGGEKICIDDPAVPDCLKTRHPLAIVLKNKLEFYSPIGKRIASSKVGDPGELIGFARILNGNKTTRLSRYDVSSGIRNLIIPCKISDSRHHALIQKEYGVVSPAPNCMKDQHNTFTELAAFHKWHSKLLLLPNEIVNMLIENDPQVAGLRNYLVNLHRSSYGIGHYDSDMWDMILSQIAEDYNLSGYKDAFEAVRQILVIRAGSAPGFIPSNDESNGPLPYFSNVYLNSYDILKLNNHYPFFMASAQINKYNAPIYYTLSYQTSLRYTNSTKSTLNLLDLCIRLMEIYKKAILETDAKERAPALFDALVNTNIEGYHPTPGNNSNIKNSYLLPEEDERFRNKIGVFPSNFVFFTGIIKITPKNVVI